MPTPCLEALVAETNRLSIDASKFVADATLSGFHALSVLCSKKQNRRCKEIQQTGIHEVD